MTQTLKFFLLFGKDPEFAMTSSTIISFNVWRLKILKK